MSTLTQPIKWHGGKHYLADWIISHMPPHTHYVEPYFGGGSVLLRKDPMGISEVANDINNELMTFWAVLRSPEWFEELRRLVEATPFAEPCWKGTTETATEIGNEWIRVAWRFFIRARQSRQGLMRDFATLSRNRTRRGMNEQVSSWLTAIEGLPEVHARLKRVVILNRDALDVIRQQDGPSTLFYLDPPYLHDTRVTTHDYTHEMSLTEHVALLATLARIDGKFLLSGYPSDVYTEWSEGRFRCATREIDNKASSKKTKEVKTECLWMNYDPPQQETDHEKA